MDSTNSGSTQSSNSSDNQPYDSPRAESISSFLHLPLPQPPPTTSHHLLPSSSLLFDPLSPYFTSFSSPQLDPGPLNLDTPWPKPPPSSLQPSEPNCTTTTGGGTAIASSSSSWNALPFSPSGHGQCPGNSSLSQSLVQPPPPPPDHPAASTPRSSKKRSRASRRAPTTVLTTDTTNFRAMVQEFTGFPAPPFGAPPFPRPRLDLFHAATVPPYLLRPFAQKFQASSSLGPIAAASSTSSSMADAIASITRTVADANTCATSTACSNSSGASSTSASNYQLPSFDLLHQDLSNVQTPSFTLERLLQSSQPTAGYNLATGPSFGVKPQGPSDNAVGDLGGFVASEGLTLSSRADGLSGWADALRTKAGSDRAQLRQLVDRKNGDS